MPRLSIFLSIKTAETFLVLLDLKKIDDLFFLLRHSSHKESSICERVRDAKTGCFRLERLYDSDSNVRANLVDLAET